MVNGRRLTIPTDLKSANLLVDSQWNVKVRQCGHKPACKQTAGKCEVGVQRLHALAARKCTTSAQQPHLSVLPRRLPTSTCRARWRSMPQHQLW